MTPLQALGLITEILITILIVFILSYILYFRKTKLKKYSIYIVSLLLVAILFFFPKPQQNALIYFPFIFVSVFIIYLFVKEATQ